MGPGGKLTSSQCSVGGDYYTMGVLQSMLSNDVFFLKAGEDIAGHEPGK